MIDLQTLYLSYKLYISRNELMRKKSGNEFRYFKMADCEGDQRDVIEYYFHLGYTNEIILEFLKDVRARCSCAFFRACQANVQ